MTTMKLKVKIIPNNKNKKYNWILKINSTNFKKL